MSTNELDQTFQAARESLQNVLTSLNEVKPEYLAQTDRLGTELNFEDGVPYFRRILKLYQDLSECNLDYIPLRKISELTQYATELSQKITGLTNFSPTNSSNPLETRNSLMNYFKDGYDAHFNMVVPIITYSRLNQTDFGTLKHEAEKQLKMIETVVQEVKTIGQQVATEAEDILNKARQASAEVGISHHSAHFQNEANYHSRAATKWLFTTIALGIVTVLWGLFSFKLLHTPVSNPPKTIEIVQTFASKLIVLSALYYILVWSAKNFNAHRHNFVVNKHRQNALSTFETFVAAASDVDTKNAVLLQATQSIFSAQPSGYILKDSDNESPNKVIEILRSAGTVTKGA